MNQADQHGHGGDRDGVPENDTSDTLRALLGLIARIEHGLHATQEALLGGHLDYLQGATEELRCCHDELKRLLMPAPGGGARASRPGIASRVTRATGMPEIVAEVRAAQTRVVRLGRVQAALLKRAQRSLTVLANLVAGREAGYGPAASPANLMRISDPFAGGL